MHIDGGLVVRLAVLAGLGAGLLIAGWRIPSESDYTEAARIHEGITVGVNIHIEPSDLEVAYSRTYAEALASQLYPGAERLPVIDSWLGYYDGYPDARGLVYVVSLDPGPTRYSCHPAPSTTTRVVCPNYRTVEMTSVISAVTGDLVFSTERAVSYHPPSP